MLISIIDANSQSVTNSFTSLTLPVEAAVSATGGINVSRADFNVNYFQNNPALSSDTLSGWATAGHLFYFANTGFSSFSYQHRFKKVGPISFAVNHLSLGNIQGYDAVGLPLGDYRSGETTLVVGKSHEINRFRLGVNIKGVFSNLAGYRATAVLIDVGGAFVHPYQDLTVGMVIKNAGLVLSEFSPTSSSTLPFDVQAGMSYKPLHMPLRFSATAYRLSDYNIPYEDTNNATDPPGTLDKVVSHLTFGAELLIHRNVNLLFGYNFLRHQELKLESAGGGSGFTLGAAVNLKQVNFAFSRAGYVTGGAYQVSLNINTKRILIRG